MFISVTLVYGPGIQKFRLNYNSVDYHYVIQGKDYTTVWLRGGKELQISETQEEFERMISEAKQNNLIHEIFDRKEIK